MKRLTWLLILVLVACGPAGNVKPIASSVSSSVPVTASSTVLSSPTATLVLNMNPEATSELLFTPPPTLLPDKEQLMVELLKSQQCKLPCYLNILPGKTSINDAAMILEGLGARLIRRENVDDSLEYSYYLDIGDPMAPKATPISSALVYQFLQIRAKSDNGPVQLIHIGIRADGTPESSDVFRRYWTRYLTSQIFAEIGKPDELYIGVKGIGSGKGSDLILVYERLGVFIDLGGSGRETNICREGEIPQIALTMDLYSPVNTLNRYDFNEYLGDPKYWLPMENAIGIDTQNFYNLVSTYPNACIMY